MTCTSYKGVSHTLAGKTLEVSSGRILRDLRLAALCSQEQLAADAGYTQQFISLLELGKSAGSRDTWRRIARALKISVTIFEEVQTER